MLGGPGWTLKHVKKFLGSCVYTIPCGAVPKGGAEFVVFPAAKLRQVDSNATMWTQKNEKNI